MESIGVQILKLHEGGIKSVEIAHRLGVALSTVHYHLRKAGQMSSSRGSKIRGQHRNGPRLKTRQLVAELLALGVSRAEVARRLGIAKSTVSYHARELGEEMDQRFQRRFDWQLIQSYYDEGHSLRACMRLFGFSSWAWYDAVNRGIVTPRAARKPLEEVFAANTRRGRGHLKERLLRAGIKDGSCEQCGIVEWLGMPLTTALHHINGDRNDNRIENLQLLCPNCHSQTDTYSGRNGRAGMSSADFRRA